MRTVFVPTDFSDASLVALKYAIEIAQAANARVILYSAVHLPPPVADMGVVSGVPAADALIEDTKKALEGLALELSVHTTQQLDIVVELGLASDQIKAWMRAHRPWLTVMASKGTTGLERFVWGSVTRDVAEHAPTPVLVLPETFAYEPFTRVLYATDFKSVDQAVTDYLSDWVTNSADLRVHYLHVEDGALPHVVEQEHFDRFKAEMAHLSPAPSLSFELKSGHRIDAAIEAEIQSGEWNLLVVCPQHRNWLVKVFAPSVSNKLVEHLDLPILVHPGNATADLR